MSATLSLATPVPLPINGRHSLHLGTNYSLLLCLREKDKKDDQGSALPEMPLGPSRLLAHQGQLVTKFEAGPPSPPQKLDVEWQPPGDEI